MLTSLIVASVIAVSPGSVDAAISPPAALVTVTPCRLLDTRRPEDGAARLVHEAAVTLTVAGRCGVAADAVAAVLTLTAAEPIAPGYLTGWATGTERPLASSLNWSRPNETRANGAILPVGSTGTIELYTTGSPHLLVDVSGYFVVEPTPAAGRYVPVVPTRLLDTRDPAGSALVAGDVRRISLPPGVPADATALSINLTAVDSPGVGYLTVHAAGSPRPVASVLNTDGPGQTRASGTIVPVTASGFDVYSSAGGHLVVDVNGWFTGPSAPRSGDGLFVATTPTRVMDTRNDGRSQFWPNGSQAVDTTATTGQVAAVVTNITMTETSRTGYLTAFPSETAKPWVSSVNVDGAGQTVANLAVVPSGSSGLYLYSATGAHVVVDVTGWFTGPATPPSPSPHVLSNVEPPPGPDCSLYPSGRAAMVDRIAQRVWLCENGAAVTSWMPFTAGPINDAPAGEYRVFFKASPWWGAGYTLWHFTAFTRGDQGGRVAFHRYVAMTESQVGTEAFRNVSHGCFRMRADDAAFLYSFLGYGDTVRVLNNG